VQQLTRVQILAPVPDGDQQQHTDTSTDINTWTFPAGLLHSESPLHAHALVTVYYCSSRGACLTHASSAKQRIFVSNSNFEMFWSST
jgi:hypothetical protein